MLSLMAEEPRKEVAEEPIQLVHYNDRGTHTSFNESETRIPMNPPREGQVSIGPPTLAILSLAVPSIRNHASIRILPSFTLGSNCLYYRERTSFPSLR
jgi:hypothetical protein